MPGAGTYRVGIGETYDTIQSAIDQLKTDQGLSAFSATQTILVTDSRGYAPFTISELTPTASFRLIVKADTAVRPVVTRAMIPQGGSNWVGCAVTGVDYVTLQGLRAEGFQHQVIFDSSDNSIVDRLMLLGPELGWYGIWYNSSTRAEVYNCSINASYGIGLIRSTELVAVHNAINSLKHAVTVDWQGSTTGNELTSDVFHLVNNLLTCSGSIYHIQEDLLDNIGYCNGNIFNSASLAPFTSYYVANDTNNLKLITTLDEWRRVSGQDTNSFVADPEFLRTTFSQGYSIELALDNTSAAITGGIDLVTAFANLPVWIDQDKVDVDREDKVRVLGVASTPGPQQLDASVEYGYYENLVDFYYETSEITMEDDVLYELDRSLRQLDKAVPKWKAKVKSGFFFVRDTPYYLFAQKMGLYLQGITWSKVELPARMIVDTVSINGTDVDWMQRGTTLWANHSTVSLAQPYSEDVHVHGIEPVWEETSESFIDYNRAYDFPIVEYPREYYLPIHPQDAAPVIITDDTVSPYTDRDLLPMEFSLVYDADLEKTKLNLQGATNLFQNPHFHYEDTAWGATTASFLDSSEHTPLFGYKYLRHTGASTVLEQQVWRTDLQKDMVLSFYAHTHSAGQLQLGVSTYRSDGTFYQLQAQSLSLPNETSEDAWRRYVVFLKAHEDSELESYGAPYDTRLTDFSLVTLDNENSPSIMFSLESFGGTSELDGMMLSEGNFVPRYAGVSYGQETTLEMEGSDKQLYEVHDLSLVSIVNPQHTGFLAITPVPGYQLDTSSPEGETTLTDGYSPLRLELPWAKLDGPEKIYNVDDEFSIEPVGLTREANFVQDPQTLRTIECRPDPIVVRQGLKKSFTIFASDDRKNPFSYEDMTLTLRSTNGTYPGLLGLRELGSPSQLGGEITAKTDPSGGLTAEIYAPNNVERSFETSEISASLETFYEINPENNGNITIQSTRTGGYLDLSGSEMSEDVVASDSGLYATASLSKTPVFGSVSVYVDDTSSFDRRLYESINPLFGDSEFYVDYDERILSVPSSNEGTVRVTYEPALAWIDGVNMTTVHLESSLLSVLTSEFILGHDAKVYLDVETGGQTETFDVVLRNRYTAE